MSEAAHRWLQHHSVLQPEDAVLLGASNVTQVESNLKSWCVLWHIWKFSFICLMFHRNNYWHAVKGDRFQMTLSSCWMKPGSMERRKCHIMLQCKPWFLGRGICSTHLSHTGLDVWLKWRQWVFRSTSNNITRSAEVCKSGRIWQDIDRWCCIVPFVLHNYAECF